MNTNELQRALIYCRVSHSKQAKAEVGSGLDSQEHRCRIYAANKGYEVEETFPDDVSGGGDFMKREGIVDLLKYLEDHPEHNYVIIFDDMKRFARDTMFHFKLRQTLASYSATVECLNFTFEETPEGEFYETIVAAQGQLERKQNQRQTIQKMKACLERGHWPFQVPVGYKRRKEKGMSKMLIRDEPLASIIEEALIGFASERFSTQAEVMRFLEQFPQYPRDRYGKIRAQRVKELLTRVLYAGYLSHDEWGVSLRPAIHEGLISLETFQKIQERLKTKTKVPARKDLSKDFVLRSAVVCGDCNTPLTANWSKGSTGKRYPYYHCPNSNCDESYGKSIRRDVIEGEFEDMLKSLKPTEKLFSAFSKFFKANWQHLQNNQHLLKQSLELEAVKLERQISQLLDRIVDTDSKTVAEAYERKLKQLEEQKLTIVEKMKTKSSTVRTFDEMFKSALDLISDPYKIWCSGEFADKRAVLKLVFKGRLVYERKKGLRTPETTAPFGFLSSDDLKSIMARPEGFEPPTP